MGYMRSLVIVVVASQAIVVAAVAGERTTSREASSAAGTSKRSGQHAIKDTRKAAGAPLDRVATAVDGAESSHGKDMGMWRPEPSGPQGPMQVSDAAATDVGGGDRFDLTQNRAIGRAYLGQLYWRYGNWPDAIAAYNWGIGKMDAWVKAGRPADKFLSNVAGYLSRVLHDSGLCDGSKATQIRQPSARILPASRYSPEARARNREMEVAEDPLIRTACAVPDARGGASNFGAARSPFSKKLDQAMQLALQHVSASQHLTLAPDDRPAAPWNMLARGQ